MLIVYITVLVCLRQGINVFVKFISPILKSISVAPATLQTKLDMECELKYLTSEIEKVNMMDEFAKHAKLQRLILPLKEEIKAITNEITEKHLMIQAIFRWIFHAIISVLLLYLIYLNKYEPVLAVPPELVGPFVVAKIVSFPNGVPGNIGCVFWVIVCKLAVGSCIQYCSKCYSK